MDAHLRALREGLCERDERGDETEIVEGLGAKLACDPADVVKARPRRLLGFAELVLQVGGGLLRQSTELEHYRRQRLTDLVVELLGDALPLGLLRLERVPAALVPLQLEAVEHL